MMKKNNQRQSGFTLLEALLTTAVLSGVFAIFIAIFNDYSDRVLMRSTSNYMEKLASSLETIVLHPTYFEAVYAEAMAQPNQIIDGITPADILAGNIGALALPNTSILNNAFKDTTPLRTGIAIMIRGTGTNALEIILATDGLSDDKLVRTAASFSKLNGGFYRRVADGVEHSYNAWNFPIATLAGTAWHNTVTNAANIPSPANGSYLVNYRHITFDEVAGDYLYRVQVSGRPELNTLYGDLNMGGKNILGADNIDVAGNIDMQSKAIINGSVNVANNANFIGGNFRTSGTLSTQNATINTTAGGTTGNFIVQNELETNNLNLTSANAASASFVSGMETSGTLSSVNVDTVQDIRSVDLNTTNLNVGGTGNININASTGEVIAQTITTPTLTVNGSRPIGANDVLVNNATMNNVSTEFFIINDLNVDTFGACELGC